MRHLPPEIRHEYFARVWQIVRQIPVGKVATYGTIASLLQPPAGVRTESYRAWGARWVGAAMAACPSDVPWQRVINAQGKISLRDFEDYERQRQLLEAEGVIFDENGRIDLAVYGWNWSTTSS